MVKLCNRCGEQRAALRRPKTFEQLCKQCLYTAFEEEIHETIVSHRLFSPGERVAVAASGGKDSTVLAHVLTTLNRRHNYGLDLFLLSIDEGISGYRDDSLETVKRNEAQYGIPLHVFSYKDLYGWTMDEIVAEVGTKSNCTFCGVFRRQALDRGATLLKADKVATGHNADDVAETVLLNLLRGDVPRLGRCASIITGGDSPLPRVKPFKFTYEKEIVMYAYFQKLDYFCTECIYAPFAARGAAREFVKDLEAARPRAIIDLIRSAEQFRVPQAGAGGAAAGAAAEAGAGAGFTSTPSGPQPGSCVRCGYLSSQDVCKACQLLEGLNKGLPRLGISRTRPGGSTGRAKGRKSAAAPAVTAGAAAAAAAAAAGSASASAGSEQQQGCGTAECACKAASGAGQVVPATSCGSSAGAAPLPAAAAPAAAGCCQQQGAQGRSCGTAEPLAAERQAELGDSAGESDQQQQEQQCGQAGGEGGSEAPGTAEGPHSYLLSKSAIAAHPSARTLAYE